MLGLEMTNPGVGNQSALCEFFRTGLSAGTWNCRALMAMEPQKRVAKFEHLINNVTSLDIFCLQEVHGDIDSVAIALQILERTHNYIHYPGPTAATGGIIIGWKHCLDSDCETCEAKNLISGRAASITFQKKSSEGKVISLSVFGAHNFGCSQLRVEPRAKTLLSAQFVSCN